MRKYCILFTFFIIIFSACSKKTYSTEYFPKENFPQTWIGTWKGELNIYHPQNLAQRVTMELEIGKTSKSNLYTWITTYDEDQEKGRRNYELKIIDEEKGLYVIDEKNSIELESYLFQNRLISRFEVNRNLLTCTYEKQGDQIIFEVIAGSQKEVSVTGGEEFEGLSIPPVRAYPISVSQRAILIKQ